MGNIGEYILGFMWVFGALFVWPFFHFWLKFGSRETYWLRWQFGFQIVGLTLSFAAVWYYFSFGHPDTIHALIFPYTVGLLSWIGTGIIVAIMNVKRW